MRSPIRVVNGKQRSWHFSRGKDFKTLVLTAFFGYFLPLLAESTPPEAYDNRRSAPTVRRGVGTPPYGYWGLVRAGRCGHRSLQRNALQGGTHVSRRSPSREKRRLMAPGILFYVDKKNYATFSRIFCLHNDVENSVDNVHNPFYKADFIRLLSCYKNGSCLTFLNLIAIFVRESPGTCQNRRNAVK